MPVWKWVFLNGNGPPPNTPRYSLPSGELSSSRLLPTNPVMALLVTSPSFPRLWLPPSSFSSCSIAALLPVRPSLPSSNSTPSELKASSAPSSSILPTSVSTRLDDSCTHTERWGWIFKPGAGWVPKRLSGCSRLLHSPTHPCTAPSCNTASAASTTTASQAYQPQSPASTRHIALLSLFPPPH